MKSRSAHRWMMAATAAGLVACSGGSNDVAPPSLDTVVTAPPTSEAATTTSAPTPDSVVTTEVSTTVGPTTTAEAGGPMFSDALGVKVDTAPGVRTPGDTRQLLPEGLYVHIAWEADPDDPSVFTVQPDDVPILEAYANASLAYYRAATTTVTVDPADFAEFMTDAGAQYEQKFKEARAAGYVGSLGNGVLLRPYVLGDQRTADSAVVLDCYLQNEQYVLRDGGEPSLGPLEPKGTVATMVRQDGQWKVEIIAAEQSACV